MNISLSKTMMDGYRKAGGKHPEMVGLLLDSEQYHYYSTSMDSDLMGDKDMEILIDLAKTISFDDDERRTAPGLLYRPVRLVRF